MKSTIVLKSVWVEYGAGRWARQKEFREGDSESPRLGQGCMGIEQVKFDFLTQV